METRKHDQSRHHDAGRQHAMVATDSPILYARLQAENAEMVAAGGTESSIPADAFPGYELIEMIHRGGQGIVYKARQASTGLIVALKILKSGRHADAIEQIRFRRELDALARLKHDNIVALRDGGIADGAQYLVMDHVEGYTLDEYIRMNGTHLPDVLHLFLGICRAVQSAHQRGVIHRDLKPANILVDEKHRAHVLDFGLAKIVEGDEQTNDYATITGQFLGSLNWASPEQARGETDEVDVLTDVYALGLLLNFCLTGKHPVDKSMQLHDTLREIIESPPERPSRHRPELDDDMDTITLRCLAKDKRERYQSVEALIADIEHYLNNRPIEAKRDSTWYVLSKAARRHKAGVILALLAVVATLVYALTMTAMYGRAMQAERIADQKSHDLRLAFQKSHKTIQMLLQDVDNELRRLDGGEDARLLILDRAHGSLVDLLNDLSSDPALLRDYAKALAALGDVDEALQRSSQSLRRHQIALSVREELAREFPDNRDDQVAYSIALVRVGDIRKQLGDRSETLDLYEQAFEIDKALVERFPDDLSLQDNLLWSHERLGALARLNGNPELSRRHFDRQLAIARRLYEQEPESIKRMDALRRAHAQLARPAGHRRDWNAAAEHHGAGVEISRRIYESDPENLWARRTLASSQLALSFVLLKIKQTEEALATVEEARQLIEPLMKIAPERVDNLTLMKRYHGSLYSIAAAMQDHESMDYHIRQKLQCMEVMVERNEESVFLREEFIGSLLDVARCDANAGDMDAAHIRTQRADDLIEKSLQSEQATLNVYLLKARLLSSPPVPDFRDIDGAVHFAQLAAEKSGGKDPDVLAKLAEMHLAAGNTPAALAAFRNAHDCPSIQGSTKQRHIRKSINRLTANTTREITPPANATPENASSQNASR